MASILFYLGILFTIAVSIICAQGPHNVAPQDQKDGGIFDLTLNLVAASSRVEVQRKTPVLLNCSYPIQADYHNFKPVSYSWRKDGKIIEIDNSKPRPRFQLFSNGSLLLRPRRKKSKGGRTRKLDGLYTCVVTTPSGRLIARRVKVVVASIDKNFTKEPVSQNVPEGSVARFECDIRAKPKPYYEWNRDNAMLIRDDPRISILPFGVLQIRNVTVSDQGLFWCQAIPFLHSSQVKMADFRWKSSKPAQLTITPGIQARPPWIVAGPQNTIAEEGETVYLECLADAWPLPVVTWRRLGGKKVWSGQHISNLVFPKVSFGDAGIYECSVSSGGKTVTANATLSVHVLPELIQERRSHHYPASRNFGEDCEIIKGHPEPTRSWYRNGQLLSKSGLTHRISKDGRLQFTNPQTWDSGIYQCVANNSAGQAISTTYVSITISPNAPPTPKNFSAKALSSTDVLFTWTLERDIISHAIALGRAKNDPDPWGAKLCQHRKDGPTYSCVVKDFEPYTTYDYSLQIIGNKKPSQVADIVEFTTLESVPSGLPALEISDLPPYNLNVTWTPLPLHLSHGKVIQYRLMYRKKGDVIHVELTVPAPQTNFIIHGVEPETTYEILVEAATKEGFALFDPQSLPWVRHTTQQHTGVASPHFNFIFVNLTSVMLQWQASAGNALVGDVKGYTVKYWPIGKDTEEKTEELTNDSTSHTLVGLDNNTYYEVTLIAKMVVGIASPTTREFKILDLMDMLIPTGLRATKVTSDSISIVWSPVASKNLQYQVCVRQPAMENTCHITESNSFQAIDTKPLTSYEFLVRVLIQDWKGQFSSALRIVTKPTVPSSPVNFTVDLLREGSVLLKWLKPSETSGDITSYKILYRKAGNPPGGAIPWKPITVTGEIESYKLDDLDPEMYYFRLRAETSAGPGLFTPIKEITPVCPESMMNCKIPKPIKPPEKTTNATGPSILIIVAIVASCIVVLIVSILIICFCRQRCRKNRELEANTSRVPIYLSSNGHVPTVYTHTDAHGNHRPINGHAYPIRQTNLDTSSHEFMPMIQIDEHDLPDSKGESDTFVLPNGYRMNGFIKHYNYNDRHSAISPITKLHGDINSEEMRGLIAGDGNHTALIMSSSLDDMDGTGNGVDGLLHNRGEDLSSEDSGTGSSRAPCPQFVGSRGNSNSQGLASPASSPGSCSSHDVSSNALPRPCHNHHHHHHHQHHRPLHDGPQHTTYTSEMTDDGFQRWGDEIGGVRIDPSTGTVIGVMESPHHNNHQQHPQQPPPPSSSGIPGQDGEMLWVNSGAVRDGYGNYDNKKDDDECDDNNSVDREGDRDSGHGSEVKMNHDPTTTTPTNPKATFSDIDFHCDDDDDHAVDYLPSYTTSSSTIHSHDTGGKVSSRSSNCSNNDDPDMDNNGHSIGNQFVVSPSDSQQLSLPLPPPPPLPPPLSPLSDIVSQPPPPPSSFSSSSSPPSSQQLRSFTSTSTAPSSNSSSRNKKHSNKLPPSSSSTSRRVSNRLVNSTSECDELPPPPPPPPVAMATPLTSSSHQAANDQGSSTTPQGQLVGNHDGVIFSSPSSPPTPPHENGSQSAQWNPSSFNIA